MPYQNQATAHELFDHVLEASMGIAETFRTKSPLSRSNLFEPSKDTSIANCCSFECQRTRIEAPYYRLPIEDACTCWSQLDQLRAIERSRAV